MTTRIEIRRPDDWHLHLRDGAMLEAVLPHTAETFGRAIVMPNLRPPVRTMADLRAYRERIVAALPAQSRFKPLMTLYLTEETDPADIETGAASGELSAVKLYPAGATTNSDSGVTDFSRVERVFAAMQASGVPLLVHGEVTDPAVDIFDREAAFIETILSPLRRRLPDLKIVMEHVTTREGVQFVETADGPTGATITPHHLMINRTDIFRGGIRPHLYCLPIAKREVHRQALRKAATSGNPRFFLGTDSAPHPIGDKESACGCAGVYNAPVTMACLAQVFEEEGALDRLEAFASLNGPLFYGLEPNSDRIALAKRPPAAELFADVAVSGTQAVKVFQPDGGLSWSIERA